MAKSTHISMLIDASGSMDNVKDTIVRSTNEFLHDQKRLAGKATLTLATFASNPFDKDVPTFSVLYDGVDLGSLKSLSKLQYAPAGYTPLLDSIARMIHLTGDWYDALPRQQRPTVVFVIITDGEENASVKFTKLAINEMIGIRRMHDNWVFTFLGSNMDAVKEAGGIGIDPNASLTVSSSYGRNAVQGTKLMYASLSKAVTEVRRGSSGISYSDEEREEQDTLIKDDANSR